MQQAIASLQLTGIDESLISLAFTHKSYANENEDPHKAGFAAKHNERLEFIGDSILGVIISIALYKKYSSQDEGYLSKMKAQIVSEPTLAKVALDLKLGKWLKLGKGEEVNEGRSRPSTLSNTVEAVIGAIYLSKGFEFTQGKVLGWFKPYINKTNVVEKSIDYKSALQEKLMQLKKIRPHYHVISENGPDHEKLFVIELKIPGFEMLTSQGSSKKKAEQQVAKKALELLQY